MELTQNINEVVDISDWKIDEEYRRYPEGARTKALVYSPIQPLQAFLKPNYPYLFKLSSHRYPEQFWVEIFSYQLGMMLDVPVPPSFVAFNGTNYGALIEWFLDQKDEDFEPGGDFFLDMLPYFDRKKGRQHNFETITQIFQGLGIKYPVLKHSWLSYWAKVFVFDALIGNTDRHQDNWGIIVNNDDGSDARIAPAFDNGTSLGHEIREDKFVLTFNSQWLERYIEKGHHHIRWTKNDLEPAGHFSLLEKLKARYPDTLPVMINCLNKVNFDGINDIFKRLCCFDIPVRLTKERSAFMLTLIKARYRKILFALEK